MHANVDIEAQRQEPVVFHLTGKRTGNNLDDVKGLRPALLAGYRDLTQLRYDFPIVLTDETGGTPVRSLSSTIDVLLQRIAPPGIASEQLRKLVLRIEREIRVLAAQGASGKLSELWDQAAEQLAGRLGAAFEKNVTIARAALDVDGDVLDCNAQTAARLVTHLWSAVQEDKARKFRATASRLAVKLADILRADFARSAAGRQVENLRAAIGTPQQTLFDFNSMSRLLPRASAREAMPDSRRQRVEWALSTLKGQRFFAPVPGQTRPEQAEPFAFAFESCAEAVAAFRARLPAMVDLVKAIAIAELEADGLYVESRHDAYFEGFDADALGPTDMAMFPDYLVSLNGHGEAEHAGLIEALSSGVPLKVIVNVPDLLQEPGSGDGMFPAGLRGTQLASMVTALSDVFVLQSVSSNLYQMRDRLMRGLTLTGPALFSVFSGAGAEDTSLPPYLSAAAAMQSRAFPAFTFDPTAGADLATRFSLEDNPQPENDWTVQRFEYADEDLQRVTQELTFTFADFLASDRRHARHFARATCTDWNARMVPVAEWLKRGTVGTADMVPFVFAVDDDDMLQRVIVDEKAIQATRRCLEVWHRLQEFGGVHSSHAERLLAREKAAWEEAKQREIESLKAEAAPAASAAATAAPAATPAAASATPAVAAPQEPERSADEPYIETIRCSSCNECIQINDRMFVYNDNKQAYIADPDAGTYRQLVEAAESCQIGIIHPGKPRNPDEPGLDELKERAAEFA